MCRSGWMRQSCRNSRIQRNTEKRHGGRPSVRERVSRVGTSGGLGDGRDAAGCAGIYKVALREGRMCTVTLS
jgi:hypothetical protein